MAEAFVCAGAMLVATDLAADALDDLVADLTPLCSALGVDPPVAAAFDASDLDAFQAFVGGAVRRAGHIDGLFNASFVTGHVPGVNGGSRL